MILVDANLLIYAVNLDAPHHERAALAIERGATICSADYDFRRFTGVEHVNPLEDSASGQR